MKNKESLDNPWFFGTIVLIAFLGIVIPSVKLFIQKDNEKIVKEKKEHPDFNLPDFLPNDCFLVSKKGESLHPHYIKILEKNKVNKNYEVLEIIGNGKDQEVSIRINYYDEMKSFANYRETCPKFLVK